MREAITLTGIDKALISLNPTLYKKALNRTLNELGRKTITSMSKEVREKYNIKAKDLRKYITVSKSSFGRLEYKIDISSKRRNVTNFGARILNTKGKVSVLIRKDRGRSVLTRAFKAKNSPAILHRKKGTQIISSVTTLSVPQMFNSNTLEKAYNLNERESSKTFKRNFEYYIGRN
jgi:hypothetical protein